MNPPNAELAISDSAAEIAAPLPRGTRVGGRRRRVLARGARAGGRRRRWLRRRALPPGLLRAYAYADARAAVRARARSATAEHATAEHATAEHATAEHATAEHATAEHAAAVRDCARALVGSRALVWVAVCAAVLAFGYGPLRHAFNPPHTTQGFGWLGDLLAAPAARWDSSWYLVIAHYGYRPDLGHFTVARDAFFPLYPLGIGSLADLGIPAVLGGVVISLLALALALYGIHRLTVLELVRTRRTLSGQRAREVAQLAVLLTAFGPMAFFLSAVYSEALYLALSIGVFYAARTGRFAAASLLGALAAATRSAGLLLLLPVLILYLYGPREDRVPDFVRSLPRELAPSGMVASTRRLLRALAPRYRVRGDALWIALFPAGLVLFMGYLALGGGDPLAPFHAQQDWGRQFAGPLAGLWDAASAAFEGARQLLSLQSQHAYFPVAPKNTPAIAASHNLVDFAFLLAAIPALVGVLRRLPFAYFAYVLAALALALSYPIVTEPLMSLPRFLLVLFPLTIAVAAWLSEHPRLRIPALVFSAALMAVSAAQFATWHWVA